MAIPRALEPSGLVLVDKPVGPSSFQVVRRLRTRTGARAGHAGTLDPFASGLLLVLLGASTRLARYLVGLDKRYLTEIDLRRRTSSGDIEGEPIEEREAPELAHLERLLEDFRGEVELLVPAFSAVKIGGERAYRLARQGKAPEMPLRRSRIDEVCLLDYSGGVARLATSAACRQGENGRQGQGYFYHGLFHSLPLAPRLLRTPFLLCRGRRDKAKKNPSHPADQRLPRKIALDLRGLGKFISDSCISVQQMYSSRAK